MKTKYNLSRRGFLARSVQSVAAVGAAGLSGDLASAAQKAPAARPAIPDYAESLEALRKTDPKLLLYEPAGRSASPHPDPKRLCFGPEGRLVICAGKFLTILDRDGTKALDLELKDEVRAAAVAADGEIYVSLRDHVEVLNAKGQPRAQWETPAKRAWLASLAVGEKDVFASDATNKVVYRYDRSGKLLGRIGEKNAAWKTPGFVVPSPYFDLEIGTDGLLWVANPGRSQVEAYSFDGRIEQAWGEPSFGIKGFCGCCNPSYFARQSDGRFITSEKGLTRIKVYDAGGRFECVVAGPEAFPKYSENVNASPIPLDVAVDAEGRVHVVDTLGHEICIYKRKDKV